MTLLIVQKRGTRPAYSQKDRHRVPGIRQLCAHISKVTNPVEAAQVPTQAVSALRQRAAQAADRQGPLETDELIMIAINNDQVNLLIYSFIICYLI